MKHETAILQVEGMSCSHCENSIKKALGAVHGVNNVAVDLQAKQVKVDYDLERVPLQTIKATIEKIGYEII